MSLTALWRLKSWWSPSPQAPASPPLLWRETELRGASLRAGSASVSSSAGCSQPRLDPWDPAILDLVNITPSVSCHSSQPSLLYTRQERYPGSVSMAPGLYYDRFCLCMEATYPHAIKNQRGASKSESLWIWTNESAPL